MTPRTINILFLATLISVPLGQAALEFRRGERPQVLDVVGPLEPARLRAFEDQLREASFLHQKVGPWYQLGMLKLLGHGNSKVQVGRDGWLHYAEDLEYLHGTSSLLQGPALDTIVDLRDQLAAQDIELLLVPVPPKTCAHADTLASSMAASSWLDHSEAAAFYAELRKRGVSHLRVDELLQAVEGPAYLARDTHWTPAGMERVAAAAADWLRRTVETAAPEPRPMTEREDSAPGDLARMLSVPTGQAPFEDERVRHFVPAGEPVVFDDAAPLLLLGDSFSRIYSDPELGFGTGAGFGETLAERIGDLDRIALSGGGARAVREALARRAGLSVDTGGLAAKRAVIWQFSMRDLVASDERWAPIDLGLADSVERAAFRGPVEVTARLMESSAAPEGFDYAFLLGLHEFELLDGAPPLTAGGRSWVALPLLRDWQATPEAALTVGGRYQLLLEPVEAHYDLEETSWVDDTSAPLRARLWFATTLTALD